MGVQKKFKSHQTFPEKITQDLKNRYEATDKTYLHMEVHLSQKAESLYLVLKKVDQNADE